MPAGVLQSSKQGVNKVKLLLNNTFTHFHPKNMIVVKKIRDLPGDLLQTKTCQKSVIMDLDLFLMLS